MNSRVFRTIGLLIAVTAMVPSVCVADPIFQGSDAIFGGGVDQIVPALYFAIGSASSSVPLFEGYQFTTADVGKTFIDSQSNDPNFNALVNILNIDDEGLVAGFVGQGVPGGALGPEGGIFVPNFFYLSGYHIDNIDLTLNQLTMVSPGRNPNTDGRWTDISFTVSLQINSSPIPEPSVGLLSSVFLGSTWLLRKKNVSPGYLSLAAQAKRFWPYSNGQWMSK